MTLAEALRISANQREASSLLDLVCGFTPLHLATFLRAHLALRMRERNVALRTGVFGNVVASLESIDAPSEAVVVVIEWSDLDGRLSYRSLADWTASSLASIPAMAGQQLERILDEVRRLAARTPVVIAPPSLPFPLCDHRSPGEIGILEARVRGAVAAFCAEAVACAGVVLINVEEPTPLPARLALRSELAAGFPYTLEHADRLAESIAAAAAAREPMKGLITDLDDTLWRGVIGEDGVEAVAWTHDRHAELHGIYQQLLQSLRASGVLLAVASRNDPNVAQAGLNRSDLLVGADAFFPVQANWGRKSESVQNILRVWNVHPSSVVFVDDSAIELAEVQAAFPEMTCMRFPGRDAAAMLPFLTDLRRAFGKRSVNADDLLRAASIKANALADMTPTLDLPTIERFLAAAEGRIRFSEDEVSTRGRAFELLHKTNQFNMNGRRPTPAEWRNYIERTDVRLLIVEYADRFARLGTIALIAGRQRKSRLELDHWVMSCRAFSRRIEHRALAELFERFDVDEIAFDYVATARNAPFASFLNGYVEPLSGDATLARAHFLERCPPLYHHIVA